MRRLALVLVLLWAVIAVTTVRAEPSIVKLFYFYSETCPHCQSVRSEVLPPLLTQHGDRLQIRYFDIAVPANYQALLAIEKRYQVTSPDLPEIFVGERALLGEPAIRTEFEQVINDYLQRGGVDYPQPDLLPATPEPTAPANPTAAPTPTSGSFSSFQRIPPEGCRWCSPSQGSSNVLPVVYLAYFYNQSCRECDRVGYDLTFLQGSYPNLSIRSFDIEANAALNEALCERYHVPNEKRLVAPAVFIGEDYRIASDINAEDLKDIIGKYAVAGSKPPWEMVSGEQASQSIVERFRSFSVLTVIGAGLIDGINPCAFAGIIFFVSYLAITKRKGREILLVGVTYTLGVFLSYLLIGLGILSFVKQLSFIHVFARAIYIGTMLLCIVLAALSLRDYIQIRRGKKEDVALRLPKALQERMHRVIREQSRMRRFIPAAFVTGFLVSLIEFACTGQVYLPTIIFVTGLPELRNNALAYLVLYNLLFVTPLAIIFLLTFFGTTWKNLNWFLESNMGAIKLLSAALFALLALWLGAYIF